MKTRLFSSDIECESCVKVLRKTLERNKQVTNFVITTSYIDLEYEHPGVLKEIMKMIREKGYRVSESPNTRPELFVRFKEFLKDKEKYHVEWRLLRYIIYALFIGVFLQGLFIVAMERTVSGFAQTYGSWLLYLTVSVILLGGALWHFKAYRSTVTCMTGMMIGMTIGMQTGMLIGAVFGITNGFFWGATIGMLLGSGVGAWAGNCCGIMGVIEGLMAGIMGGTMGSMITVMMFYDHIQIFMPLFVFLNALVLLGFSYMLFEELVEEKDVHVQPASFSKFLMLCIIAIIALTCLVVYLPKSIFLG